jgi:signal transduction histidine kinase
MNNMNSWWISSRSLRRKTLVTLLSVFGLLVALMYAVSRQVILGEHAALETEIARQTAQRAVALLDQWQADLSSTLVDWAQWDDTYQFMQDRNSRYLESNFGPQTSDAIRVDLMLFFDRDGQIHHRQPLHPDSGAQFENGLVQFIQGQRQIWDPSTRTGMQAILLSTDQPPVLAASAIIADTAMSDGVNAGTLVFLRYLSSQRFAELAASQDSIVSISGVEETGPDRDWAAFGPLDFPAADVSVEFPSHDSVAVSARIPGIDSGRGAMLTVLEPRPLWREGRNTLTYFTVWFIGIGAVLAMAGLLVLDKSILRRIARLSDQVAKVRGGRELSSRVDAEGDDELARLAAAINELLERLSHSIEQEIIEVTGRQQARIGRDLHDNLGQLLTGAALRIGALKRSLDVEPATAAAEIDELAAILNKALAETSALAKGIAPVQLTGTGLIDALEELTKDVERMFEIRCRLCVNRGVRVTEDDAAIHLYHIAKEAITNAVKHGRAKHVTVTLDRDAEHATLAVDNDGISISSGAQRQSGLGLRLMRIRAHMIGGRLRVYPHADNGGTRVVCTFPTAGVTLGLVDVPTVEVA